MAKSYSTPTQLPLPIEGETVEIPLTKDNIGLLDAVDAELAAFKWNTTHGYAERNYLGQHLRLHRIVMERVLGRPLLDSEHVDHINGNGFDCRRINLRLATRTQNMRNTKIRANNSSGYKGVSYMQKDDLWRAYISFDGHQHSLGCYYSAEDAAIAYNNAAKLHFGEYARLNQIPNWENRIKDVVGVEKLRRDNRSGYKNVTKYGDRYYAKVQLSNGKIKGIGFFNTPEDAHNAQLRFREEQDA